MQIKKYLEANLDVSEYDIISLAMNNEKKLRNEINNILQEHRIVCLIGTYNPNLFGIPFISVSKLLNMPKDKLELIETIENQEDLNMTDYEKVFEYLGEALPDLNQKKLKKCLMKVMNRIKVKYSLNMDQKIGLLMHMACMIPRLEKEKKDVADDKINRYIIRNKKIYTDLKEILIPLEDDFCVTVTDTEMKCIIEIIKKGK